MQRRDFLHRGVQWGMALALAANSPLSVAARRDTTLTLMNTHTGEQVKATLISNGQLQANELAALNRVMRDHRNNQQMAIDPELYRQMAALQQLFGKSAPMEIISGYRSPASNELLRANSSGVAKKSLHMEGKAVDIRIPGVSTRQLQQAALAMRQGGVGYYPDSGFVHIDTGKVRHW